VRKIPKDPKTGKLLGELKEFEKIVSVGNNYVVVDIDIEALAEAVRELKAQVAGGITSE